MSGPLTWAAREMAERYGLTELPAEPWPLRFLALELWRERPSKALGRQLQLSLWAEEKMCLIFFLCALRPRPFYGRELLQKGQELLDGRAPPRAVALPAQAAAPLRCWRQEEAQRRKERLARAMVAQLRPEK